MLELNVSAYRAVATAAVRKASNRMEFIDLAKERAGIDIEVISGEEEAALTLAGTLGVIKDDPDSVLVFDVGGGSTELIRRENRNAVNIYSLDIGAVNITERFFKDHDPPLAEEMARAKQFIGGALTESVFDLRANRRFAGSSEPRAR